uniref:Uncharacterized protein n=1 Tax=Arion vulgaris TaxID=1028688 RepID=A0A0B6ZFH1_9EUPU
MTTLNGVKMTKNIGFNAFVYQHFLEILVQSVSLKDKFWKTESVSRSDLRIET